MSKVLCLVLSFIIGASAYQTLEARSEAAMVANRAMAQGDFNEAKELHPLNTHDGKKSKGNGTNSGQGFDSNLNLLNNITSRINMRGALNRQDERTSFSNQGFDSKFPNGNIESPNIKQDESKRGHLNAEYMLSMNTVNAWNKIQADPFTGGQDTCFDAVVKSQDMRLIDHLVDSIMSFDVRDKINKKTVKLTDTVTHLFPDKSNVTYNELMNKYNELRESYMVAAGAGDINNDESKNLKQQMDELGYLAGQIVKTIDQKPTIVDTGKMYEKMLDEEAHANKVKKDGPEINWKALSAKDQMLLQSKHLQETFNAGYDANDHERYAASKEILDRAALLNDYDSLKLIRENTKDSGGLSGTGGLGATKHSAKILEHKVKDEKGNTLTVKELEEKIEALQKNMPKDENDINYNLRDKEELDKHVALYAKALQEYAENNKSGGVWWVQIPEKEFAAAEHQNEHIETFRRENTMAAHYNNKTNATASSETNSKN